MKNILLYKNNEIIDVEKPSASDKGYNYTYTVFFTKYGYTAIIKNNNLIKELFLPEENYDKIVNKIREKYPNAAENESDILLVKLKERIVGYFNGQIVDFSDIEIDYTGYKDFSKKIFEIIKKIPYGITRTYKSIAEELKSPKLTRVIGKVLNRNKVPIIIPCHRVIKSDGELGGFSFGLDWKIRLLKIEKIL